MPTDLTSVVTVSCWGTLLYVMGRLNCTTLSCFYLMYEDWGFSSRCPKLKTHYQYISSLDSRKGFSPPAFRTTYDRTMRQIILVLHLGNIVAFDEKVRSIECICSFQLQTLDGSKKRIFSSQPITRNLTPPQIHISLQWFPPSY